MKVVHVLVCLLAVLLVSAASAEMKPDELIDRLVQEIDARRIACPGGGDFEDMQGVTCVRPNRESDFELFKHRWKLATERIFGENPPPGIPWQKLNANVHVTGYRIAGADVLIVHQVYDEKLTILLGWRPVQ